MWKVFLVMIRLCFVSIRIQIWLFVNDCFRFFVHAKKKPTVKGIKFERYPSPYNGNIHWWITSHCVTEILSPNLKMLVFQSQVQNIYNFAISKVQRLCRNYYINFKTLETAMMIFSLTLISSLTQVILKNHQI